MEHHIIQNGGQVKIMNNISTFSNNVNFKDLSITTFKNALEERQYICLKNPDGELFKAKKGLYIDIQSINLICTIYDALNSENKVKFNEVICKDEYKLANFFEKMWGMVK